MDAFYVLLALIIVFGIMFLHSCYDMFTQEGMENKDTKKKTKKTVKKAPKKKKVKTLPF
tara:strand:- start:1708 stop:1884 length:177 start_codon:yes stop_codon:yes gene_type:complete